MIGNLHAEALVLCTRHMRTPHIHQSRRSGLEWSVPDYCWGCKNRTMTELTCGLPLVLVYPSELLTSYWTWGIRGISSMLETGPRLSSEARLRCSSGPPERTGGDTPMLVLTSTEPQLFLPLASFSRPILKHIAADPLLKVHKVLQRKTILDKLYLKLVLLWIREGPGSLNTWAS